MATTLGCLLQHLEEGTQSVAMTGFEPQTTQMMVSLGSGSTQPRRLRA